MAHRVKNFVGGQFVESGNNASDNTIDSINPATGEVFAVLPNSNAEDVEVIAP